LLDEGVCPDRFRKRHGIDLRERFAQEIADLEKLRMLTMAPDSLRLTPRGLEVSNQIFEKFI